MDAVKPKFSLGVRHLQALMLFLAQALCFGMRISISIAIVAMTDKTKENTFDWNLQTKSLILSSFLWGYVVLQIAGGELASRFGGKILISLLVAVNAKVSLILPTAAHYGGWQMVCACRVIQGLLQGFLLPSCHILVSKWSPIAERGRFVSTIFAGAQIGIAIQLSTGGYIAEYWGWEKIFYINGALGVMWTVLYIFIGSSSPQDSKVISEEERHYIMKSLGVIDQQKAYKTPWSKIMTSFPVLALIIVHMSQNWGFWTLMTETPTYMSKILGVNIKSNGVLSSIPYIVTYFMSFFFGFMSDFLLKKGWISVSACRKLSNSIAFYGPAIFLIGLSNAPANIIFAVTILSIVVGLNAGNSTGFLMVHIDMAPNFSGSMLGITNTFATLISILAPVVAGYIIKDEYDSKEWRKVFYLASFIYILGNTIFIIFGSSVRQKWNEPENKDVEVNNKTNAESMEKRTENGV